MDPLSTSAPNVGAAAEVTATLAPAPTVSAPISNPSQSTTLMETIRTLQTRIAQYGPGPHTPKQKEELQKLAQLLQKAQSQVQSQPQPNLVNSVATTMPGAAPTATLPSSVPASGLTIRTPAPGAHPVSTQVLDKKRLQDLVKEVDPLEQLDDDVEELLMQIADDFIDNVTTAACQLAKHRKSNTVETKDVQLHLERNWNMWIPGFGSEEVRPYKKAATTEAHKQRLALIKKTLKKY